MVWDVDGEGWPTVKGTVWETPWEFGGVHSAGRSEHSPTLDSRAQAKNHVGDWGERPSTK